MFIKYSGYQKGQQEEYLSLGMSTSMRKNFHIHLFSTRNQRLLQQTQIQFYHGYQFQTQQLHTIAQFLKPTQTLYKTNLILPMNQSHWHPQQQPLLILINLVPPHLTPFTHSHYPHPAPLLWLQMNIP